MEKLFQGAATLLLVSTLNARLLTRFAHGTPFTYQDGAAIIGN